MGGTTLVGAMDGVATLALLSSISTVVSADPKCTC